MYIRYKCKYCGSKRTNIESKHGEMRQCKCHDCDHRFLVFGSEFKKKKKEKELGSMPGLESPF